nr:hypothetical protein [Dyadobacter luticola]
MSKNSRLFYGIFMAVPIAVWIFVILYYSVNLPWYDDFDPFSDFLHKWITEPDFATRLKLLFQPNNEHRMVIGKLVTLLYYWVTGHLNFTLLHIAGSSFMLGTLYLFWRAFKSSGLSWWYFLPVPFLMFQLQFHLAFLWAICALQHPPVVFFASLSMFLLAKNRFLPGMLAAIFATFAMSSGIFVWPAGVVVLVLASRYKQVAVWCVVAVVAVGLYFYGMSAQGNESSVDFFLKNPHLSVLGFFAFLGGLFDFFPEKAIFTRSVLPVLMGFLVMIWVTIWLLRRIFPWLKTTFSWPKNLPVWANQNPDNAKILQTFLVGIVTFLLVDGLVIGLLRPRFGFFVMIVSNYKIYPALFLTVAYLAFISTAVKVNVRETGFKIAVAAGVMIWAISMYSYLPVISERNKYYTVNGYNQEFNGYGLGHVPYSKSAMYVDSMMKDMVKRGVYEYPASGRLIARQAEMVSGDISKMSGIQIEDRGLAIYVNDTENRISYARNSGEYVFVRNRARLYLFKMEQHKYSGRNIFMQYDKGADVLIPNTSLLPDTYEIGIVHVNGDKTGGGVLRKITIP